MAFKRKLFLLLLISSLLEKCFLINIGNSRPFSNVYANRNSSGVAVIMYRAGLNFWSGLK